MHAATHTCTVGPPITSPLLYESYDEQQYAELQLLFEIIVSLDEPVLLGDFNHGPAFTGTVPWEFPFHYGLMNARGLISPYVFLDGRCTVGKCGGSGREASDGTPKVIDHIYILSDSFRRVKNVEVL